MLALERASIARVPSAVSRGRNLEAQKLFETDLASDQKERPPVGQTVNLLAIFKIKEFIVSSIKV